MPLVVICGHPCSGKSTVAQRIVDLCRNRGQDVTLVDEESLHLTRDASYRDVPKEKITRGLLRSATDRSLTRSAVVVLDSLNSIKGYRYELWCLARGMGTRYCTVHVDSPPEACRVWNQQRSGDAYSAAVFEDLVGRFERPDARNKWDSPLFTVRPELGPEHVAQQAEAVLASALVGPAAAVGAVGAAPDGSSGAGAAGRLIPTCATSNPLLASTNLLYELDSAAQEVVERVTQAQVEAGGGMPGDVAMGEGIPPLRMHRVMPLPELRRHKRSFVRLATNNTLSRLKDAQTGQRVFVDYLRDQLAQG